MNKIPTAEEFFRDYDTSYSSTLDAMIEFAQLHVKAALKAAAEKADMEGDEGSNFDGISIDKNSILNAYPLNLIQ